MDVALTVVGLTGGIATGKSTVAGFLREAKVPVVDADQLGRLVLEKDHVAYRPVIDAFGERVLDEEGNIDRQRLGQVVFNDPSRRRILEEITHPAIAALARRAMELIQERGEHLAFYEAALLVETGIYKSLSALVLVTCSVESQLRRLTARDGISDQAAAARIASQYPVEEKLKVANYVIDTECSLDETQESTLRILAELRSQYLVRQEP